VFPFPFSLGASAWDPGRPFAGQASFVPVGLLLQGFLSSMLTLEFKELGDAKESHVPRRTCVPPGWCFRFLMIL